MKLKTTGADTLFCRNSEWCSLLVWP